MALTTDQIVAAQNDQALFELLWDELVRLIPDSVQNDNELYFMNLPRLPRGLRAMVGIKYLDLSMQMDDLAWHFTNQTDQRDLVETHAGLRELELTEFADDFEKLWNFLKPYRLELESSDFGGRERHVWLREVGAQSLADPINERIWDYCSGHDFYLLRAWLYYARKFPERCVVCEGKA